MGGAAAMVVWRRQSFGTTDAVKTITFPTGYPIVSAKTFLVLVLLSIAVWLFRSNDGTGSGPVAAVVRMVDRVIFSSSESDPGAGAQEQDRQHRKEVAEENLRLSNERQAAHQRATAEYEQRRLVLAQQIEALERSNNHGVNNAAIEELIRQRAALSLPQ
jgi:hypothetical protein